MAKFSIGLWEILPDAYAIRNSDGTQKLEPIQMELLLHLAKTPREIVYKETLAKEVWKSEYVSDKVMAVSICNLRKALGDDAREPQYIQTVPRKGYRLIAPVEPIETEYQPKTQLEVPSGRRGFNPLWVAIGLAMIVAIPLLSWQKAGESGGAGAAQAEKKTSNNYQSIAVLPFKNYTGRDQIDYLVDGSSHTLTSELSKYSSFNVVSHTSTEQFKDDSRSISEISKILKTDLFVEGFISSEDQDIVITIQLIDGLSEKNIWSRRFERSWDEFYSAFKVISASIAHQVDRSIPFSEADQLASNLSTVSYKLLIQARQASGVPERVELFQEFVEQEPDFSVGWGELSMAYSDQAILGFTDPIQAAQKARNAAERALVLDPNSIEALVALATAHMTLNWDFERAEDYLRLAVARNPNHVRAHGVLSWHLFLRGRKTDANEIFSRMQALDPFSNSAAYFRFHRLLGNEKWNDALAYLQEHEAEMSPTQSMMLEYAVRRRLGQTDLFNLTYRSLKAMGADDEMLENYKRDYPERGNALYHEIQLESLHELKAQMYISPVQFAVHHCYMDQSEMALQYIEQAFETHSPQLLIAYSMPVFNELRHHPRFVAVLRKIGVEDESADMGQHVAIRKLEEP